MSWCKTENGYYTGDKAVQDGGVLVAQTAC